MAAAIGVNVETATVTAEIGKGRKVKSGLDTRVASEAQTANSVLAEGKQVSSAQTKAGVGAAVALNVGLTTNRAVIGDNAELATNGLTVSATMPAGTKNTSSVEAISGAGSSNVGLAGALAVNVAVNTTVSFPAGITLMPGKQPAFKVPLAQGIHNAVNFAVDGVQMSQRAMLNYEITPEVTALMVENPGSTYSGVVTIVFDANT